MTATAAPSAPSTRRGTARRRGLAPVEFMSVGPRPQATVASVRAPRDGVRAQRGQPEPDDRTRDNPGEDRDLQLGSEDARLLGRLRERRESRTRSAASGSRLELGLQDARAKA